MRYVMGIDAGGTFTDCVVLDAATNLVVHKAKTPTTAADLMRCLETSFTGLPAELVDGITLVSLSTTLATNAVVEGRGCKEGLILIGGRPRGVLPTSRHVLVRGRFDLKGRLVENVEPDQVAAAVESFRDRVDAVAVSGYASVRCPEHELLVKAVVEDRLDLPVVCAHELTSRLGFYERTVTATLNARLIPMVCDLVDSVRAVMDRRRIQAPLMLVRGDGTLMADGLAQRKPLETILSGPAASGLGGVELSGRSDCLVMDIGGTTTDVVRVENGRPVLRSDGARVGDWTTQVRAVEDITVGLGGDSRIHLDADRRLCIGPERSIGYAAAAARHPHLVDELEAFVSASASAGSPDRGYEGYALVRKFDRITYTDEESLLIEVLRRAPHTVAHLERATTLPRLSSVLAGLSRYGVVQRISLTPTDFWHVGGSYAPGRTRAAELGLQVLAEATDTTPAEVVERVRRRFATGIEQALAHAVDRDRGGSPTAPAARASHARGARRTTVVGIGAPARTWLGDRPAGSSFEVEVPEHAEVANAVGAASAHAVETLEVLIRHDTTSGRYLVFSPDGRQSWDTLEAATSAAVASGRRFLERLTGRSGLSVDPGVRDVEITGPGQDHAVFVERVVGLTAHVGP